MTAVGRLRLAVAAWVCLTSLPASGSPPQSTTSGGPPGRFKLGPVYVSPRLDFSAGVNSNVYRTETGRSDSAFSINPQVNVAFPIGRRIRLTGKGDIGVHYFRREQSERSIDRAVEGLAQVSVSRFTLFGGGGTGRFKQRFSTDLDERLARQQKQARTGFSVRVTPKFSANFSRTWNIQSFDTSKVSGTTVQEALDRTQRTKSVQFRYALTGETVLLFSGEAIEDDFVYEATGAKKPHSTRYLAGFEFGSRAVINGQVLLGIRDIPRGQGTANYHGSVLSVATSAPLLSLGRLVVAAARDVSYSGVSIATNSVSPLSRGSFVSTSIGGEASIELPFRLSGHASLGFLEAKYLSPSEIEGDAVQRIDHVWTTGGSILRHFGDKIRVGWAFARSRRVTNLAGLSYSEWRYGVQAQVVP